MDQTPDPRQNWLLAALPDAEWERGRMTVLDRPGLERRSCGCYAVVKKEYDRLLPDIKAT